ncbi:hypothetical protein HDE_11649 [Halotydeus destructor]|nr:hypothetical protein HDE_11649 [Halotydeus destructor]
MQQILRHLIRIITITSIVQSQRKQLEVKWNLCDQPQDGVFCYGAVDNDTLVTVGGTGCFKDHSCEIYVVADARTLINGGKSTDSIVWDFYSTQRGTINGNRGSTEFFFYVSQEIPQFERVFRYPENIIFVYYVSFKSKGVLDLHRGSGFQSPSSGQMFELGRLNSLCYYPSDKETYGFEDTVTGKVFSNQRHNSTGRLKFPLDGATTYGYFYEVDLLNDALYATVRRHERESSYSTNDLISSTLTHALRSDPMLLFKNGALPPVTPAATLTPTTPTTPTSDPVTESEVITSSQAAPKATKSSMVPIVIGLIVLVAILVIVGILMSRNKKALVAGQRGPPVTPGSGLTSGIGDRSTFTPMNSSVPSNFAGKIRSSLASNVSKIQ